MAAREEAPEQEIAIKKVLQDKRFKVGSVDGRGKGDEDLTRRTESCRSCVWWDTRMSST